MSRHSSDDDADDEFEEAQQYHTEPCDGPHYPGGDPVVFDRGVLVTRVHEPVETLDDVSCMKHYIKDGASETSIDEYKCMKCHTFFIGDEENKPLVMPCLRHTICEVCFMVSE
jgi:hypothetical protein